MFITRNKPISIFGVSTRSCTCSTFCVKTVTTKNTSGGNFLTEIPQDHTIDNGQPLSVARLKARRFYPFRRAFFCQKLPLLHTSHTHKPKFTYHFEPKPGVSTVPYSANTLQ